MKIAHLMHYSSPYKGNFICSLEALQTKCIANNDSFVWIFPLEAKERLWISEFSRQLPPPSVYFVNFNDKKQFKRDLFEIHKKENLDILHTHFVGLNHLLAIRKLYNKMGVKLFRHIHSEYPKQNFIKMFLRKIVHKNATFICVSNQLATQLEQAKENKNSVNVVDNAVSFERLNVIDNNFYDTAFENNDYKVIMFGYAYFIKGCDLAIKSIALLREKGLKISLYLPMATNSDFAIEQIKKEFNGEIPNWIKILPPRNDIATYYDKVDCFLSASRTEGFCCALFEAIYCKKHILCSDIPVQKELNLQCSYFESQNYLDLADKLENIIKNPPTENDLEKQKQLVVNQYNLENWANEIYKLYQQNKD